MSLRTTIIMVLLAIAAGVLVYVNPFAKEEEKTKKPPWFYQVSEADLETIEVISGDNQVKFLKTAERTWVFEDPAGIPPSHVRWGGISLLVAGPQVRRNLATTATTIENPEQYGLDEPAIIMNVGLSGGRNLDIRLGKKTTDGRHHYGQVIGFPQLFLVVRNWGEVVARLAAEPPLPKWFIKRNPEDILEVNVYSGNKTLDETRRVRFTQNQDTWTVRDFSNDSKDRAVDVNLWADIVPSLTGPPNISVEVVAVEDGDYTAWGINDDSPIIEIRFMSMSDKGTLFLDGMPFKIGSKIPDKQGYYAQPEIDLFRKPVLFLNGQWTDKLLDLLNNVPYESDTEL